MNEDKSTRYRRLQRRASLLATTSAALFLLLFIVAGGSAALRDALGGSSWLPMLAFTLVLALAYEAIHLPFAFYAGVTIERRYGLTTQTVAQWAGDHLRAAGLGLVLAVIAASGVWGLMQVSADRWWMMASLLAVLLLAGIALAAPVVLLPLFYDFTPLDRPQLVARLEALAGRLGVPVLGVYTWKLADRTRKANAALAGLGRTRRILISDTLLAEHSDDEIEVVLAHELAHHVHGDIWTSLAVEGVLLGAGLAVANVTVGVVAGMFGLTGPGDVAMLPVIALSASAVVAVLRPLANAVSRAHEWRADRFALEVTGNGPAFISAMRRLGAQNLAEEQPPKLVELLFYTHPPMAARIAEARNFPRTPGARPGRYPVRPGS